MFFKDEAVLHLFCFTTSSRLQGSTLALFDVLISQGCFDFALTS